MKYNYNLINTRESVWGKANIKFKRIMKLLLKGHGENKKGLPQPKGGNSTWEPNEK